MSEPVLHEQTQKPAAVETPIDLYFFRPAAQIVVRAALPAPVSANALTLISVLIGLLGASLLRYPHPTEIIAGAILILLYAILDCAGGQLARARGTSSRLGRILDGAGDFVVGIATLAAVAIHLLARDGAGGAALAVLGFGSVLIQAMLFDYFKNRYLARSGADDRAGDDLAETEDDIRRGGPAPALFLLHVYAMYLRVQRAIAAERHADPPAPEEAAAYADRLAPVARGWAYLGPSTHAVLFLFFVVGGGLSAYAWARLTLGNLALAALYVAQKRRERGLAAPAQG